MSDDVTADPSGLENLPPPDWPDQTVSGSPGYLPHANWSYGHIAVALITGIVVGPFVALILAAAVGGAAAARDVPTLLLLSAQAFTSIGVLYALSRIRGSGSWSTDFGFALHPRHIWGIGAGMVLQIAVALLTFPLVERFADDDGPQQEIAQVVSDLSGVEIVYFAVIVAVVTPIFEEVVFRGMLLGRLVKTLSRHRAAVISAAAFAAVHLLDPDALLVVPGLFIVGLALAYLAMHAGNLSLPIFVHMGVNALAVLLLAFQDELERLAETAEALALLL